MDSVYTNSTAVPNSITSALNNSEHWPCFQNLAGAAFFAGMELLTAAVGFPANVMVLWVLLQRKNTISSSKVFILNLAAMDAFVCLNTPLDIYNSLILGYTATLLVVMVFCNVSLLQSLRQSGSGQEEVHPIKKKAFKTVFTIFIISLVFYFPLVAIYPFKSYFNPVVFKCYLRPVCSSS
ncbi:UNVERIFIED_CONTAM: hypothetical protein FKN15_018087 [Acipenser sinensis]